MSNMIPLLLRIATFGLCAMPMLTLPTLARAQSVTEFGIPTANSQPSGITAGPDGALWFTETNGNKIGRITTAGVVTNEFTVSQPSEITAGPDGALWFTEYRTGNIGRITTAGLITEFPTPPAFLVSTLSGITTGSDGALWFTQCYMKSVEGGLLCGVSALSSRGSVIGRITTNGVITEFPLPTSNGDPRGITAGPDGALWFTEAMGNNIGRITTNGVITEFPLPTSGSAPIGITAGPDGALWFTESSGNKIGRITTNGAITEYPIQTVSAPVGITAGPDGALWFTESSGNKIGRITTAGNISEFPIQTSASAPVGVTAGPDGALWFTENSGNKIGLVGGFWTQLVGTPNNLGLNAPQLMTDGSVIFNAYCTAGTMYKLVPDNSGNYVNGTWSPIAPLPVINGLQYNPLYYAQEVLPDGRLILNGGEINHCSETIDEWTAKGAIYDPIANTWTAVTPPSGWTNIGDAQSIVLANGTYMLANALTRQMALLNISDLSWTATGAGKADGNDEEGWTLLPDGSVLTVDASCGTNSERYNPATGAWSSAGSTTVELHDCSQIENSELGPQVLRPDGTVVAFGGTTGIAHTAIFNSTTNVWGQGPDVPSVCGASRNTPCTLADAPAALLPSGSILFAASSSTAGVQGTHFFEMDTTNVITKVSDTSSSPNNFSNNNNMVVLPNGQILLTVGSSSVFVYTPTGIPQSSWRPAVSTVPGCVSPGRTYIARGTQFNGLSMGASFGDDFQSNTNFPLVQIVNNGTGHKFFARTFNHSTRSVALNASVTTSFRVAAATEAGASTLHVIANGVASLGTAITVAASCPNTTVAHDFNADGKSDITWRDGSGDMGLWLMNGATTLSPPGGFGGIPAAWSIAGIRDFNGDGMADLLWRDTSGNNAIWVMNGTQVASSIGVGNVPPTWSVIGIADFNGDGSGDIIWRDNGGNVAVWLMNSGTVSSSGGLGNVPLTWNVVGTGDYNGDGMSDLLWRDNVGNTSIWFMDGAAVASAAGVGNIATSWSVVGTGDFDGDGKADIVWRDTVGNTALWLMNGAAISSAAGLGNVPTTWSVAQTGDYNGDGMTDILWRDTSGNTSVWFMNGTSATGASVGNIPTNWTVQTVDAE